VEQFSHRTHEQRASYLRLKVETPDSHTLAHLLEELLMLGCAQADSSDALRFVERACCAPEDFYSTTNHKTHVRHQQRWIESKISAWTGSSCAAR